MVKITVENDKYKRKLSGRYAVVFTGDPEGEADYQSAMLGQSSLAELAELIGKCAGAHIKSLNIGTAGKLKMAEMVLSAMNKALMTDELLADEIEHVMEPVDKDEG